MSLFVNGVMFDASLTKTWEALVDARPRVLDAQIEKIAAFMTQEVAEFIDAKTFPGVFEKKTGATPLQAAWNFMIEKHDTMRKSGYRSPQIDADFSITLFPYQDHALAFLMGENTQWISHIHIPGRDMSWGRYERPRDVCAQEWHNREMVWTEFMGGDADWIPASKGLTFAYPFEPRLYHDAYREKIFAFLPSPENRARQVAKNMLVNEALAKHPKDPQTLKFWELTQIIMTSHDDEALIENRAADIVKDIVPITRDNVNA